MLVTVAQPLCHGKTSATSLPVFCTVAYFRNHRIVISLPALGADCVKQASGASASLPPLTQPPSGQGSAYLSPTSFPCTNLCCSSLYKNALMWRAAHAGIEILSVHVGRVQAHSPLCSMSSLLPPHNCFIASVVSFAYNLSTSATEEQKAIKDQGGPCPSLCTYASLP